MDEQLRKSSNAVSQLTAVHPSVGACTSPTRDAKCRQKNRAFKSIEDLREAEDVTSEVCR